jgi:hypothetical protein
MKCMTMCHPSSNLDAFSKKYSHSTFLKARNANPPLVIGTFYLEVTTKVEAPIRMSDLISQSIKAPTVASMHTQKWAPWILFTLELESI